jgi:YD repeat-containing protein
MRASEITENFANDNAVAKARARKKELYAVQKAIDDISDDPNWRTRRDELKKLIRRESVLEKEMQLSRSGVYRYDHDSFGRKIKENFADGKKKGKSRPGRVKKSGASCNGSVTDLRAKAKKASGEKAKMYHWCANMKSGKKKK